MSDVRYLFVDGSYLREALQVISDQYFNGEVIEVNLWGLFPGFRKGFYYDSLPGRKSDESADEYVERVKPQEEFFQRLRAHPGVHVIEGVIKGEKKRSRQKKIDVSIAVDMLTHSYRRNMDQATLLAGDLDFKPLVEALVRDGMYVTLWYEDSSASKELIYAADERRELNIHNVYELIQEDLKKKYPHPGGGSRKIERNRNEPKMVGANKGYGMKLYLYELGDEFEIVTHSGDGSDHEGFLSHPDLNYLLKYADLNWGKCEWDDRT